MSSEPSFSILQFIMSSEPRSPLPLSALCVHSTELKLLYKIGFALSRLCFVFISGKRWRRHLPYDHEHVHGRDHCAHTHTHTQGFKQWQLFVYGANNLRYCIKMPHFERQFQEIFQGSTSNLRDFLQNRDFINQNPQLVFQTDIGETCKDYSVSQTHTYTFKILHF